MRVHRGNRKNACRPAISRGIIRSRLSQACFASHVSHILSSHRSRCVPEADELHAVAVLTTKFRVTAESIYRRPLLLCQDDALHLTKRTSNRPFQNGSAVWRNVCIRSHSAFARSVNSGDTGIKPRRSAWNTSNDSFRPARGRCPNLSGPRPHPVENRKADTRYDSNGRQIQVVEPVCDPRYASNATNFVPTKPPPSPGSAKQDTPARCESWS
jgi:hypothetical protein